MSHFAQFAVSVFMMMSFFLVQKEMVSHTADKLKKRFERLIIPQIGWAVIYWCIYNIIGYFTNGQAMAGMADLMWQIICGHSPRLNPTMWFQTVLIALTLVFWGVILIFQRNYRTVLWILGATALFLQYSEINLYFFNWRFEIKYPAGRFIEMLPIAVVGFMLASGNLLEQMEKNRLFYIAAAVFIIGMDAIYGLFSPVNGYGNSGMKMVIIAMALIVLFYLIPFERLPDRVLKGISITTRYTMGIYCMHKLVATILNAAIIKFDMGIAVNSFTECVLIYILCFLCSWIGVMIFGKTKLQSLFQ